MHRSTALSKKFVIAMASAGAPQATIAKALCISDRTLRTRYRHELDVGFTRATVAVAANVHRIASTGSGAEAVRAAIFWLKARAGWSPYAPLKFGA